MDTVHTIIFGNAQQMASVDTASVDAVITSPPYPMIEMWDDSFSRLNPSIFPKIQNNPREAFEMMHQELDCVWNECFRVLKEGGFLCINIGDATRTINDEFQLFNNHSRIISHCQKLGLTSLPCILWRKQTNAPNKFMGSGMLPCGAYVTLEHEWILIFRKGHKRIYKDVVSKQQRRESSFFWEERNIWFSDVWDIKGAKQAINKPSSRNRNGSFPIEIPYRLINMFTQRGDTVLDPFAGLCTTNVAALCAERNSLGYEIDTGLRTAIIDGLNNVSVDGLNQKIQKRYCDHLDFINHKLSENKPLKYQNLFFGCAVMTNQETDLQLHFVKDVTLVDRGRSDLQIFAQYDDSTRFKSAALYQEGLFGGISIPIIQNTLDQSLS